MHATQHAADCQRLRPHLQCYAVLECCLQAVMCYIKWFKTWPWRDVFAALTQGGAWRTPWQRTSPRLAAAVALLFSPFGTPAGMWNRVRTSNVPEPHTGFQSPCVAFGIMFDVSELAPPAALPALARRKKHGCELTLKRLSFLGLARLRRGTVFERQHITLFRLPGEFPRLQPDRQFLTGPQHGCCGAETQRLYDRFVKVGIRTIQVQPQTRPRLEGAAGRPVFL